MMYGTPTSDDPAGCAHESAASGRQSQQQPPDRAVHLRSTGDHVFNIVGVARAVYARSGESGVIFNEVLMVIPRAFLPARYRSGSNARAELTVGFSQKRCSDGSSQVVYSRSTWTIVPTLTCGFVRSNFSIGYIPYYAPPSERA